MICRQCGSDIPDGFAACPGCGAPVVRKNGIALAGMIISIVAIVFCWIPYLGLILAIAGLVLSIVGACKKNAGGKGKAVAGIVVAGIALLIAVIITGAVSKTSKDKNNDQSSVAATSSANVVSDTGSTAAATTEETTVTETTVTETTEDPQITKEAFIESCSDLDYKAIARNPDNYIGQNFSFVCYVSSARTSKSKYRYYITYAVDLDEAQEKVDKGWYDDLSEARKKSVDYDVCVWLNDYRDESDPGYTKILEKDIIIVYGTFTGMTTSQNSLTGETGEEVSLDIKYVEILDE